MRIHLCGFCSRTGGEASGAEVPQIDFLREVLGVTGAAQTRDKESEELPAVQGGNGCDELLFPAAFHRSAGRCAPGGVCRQTRIVGVSQKRPWVPGGQLRLVSD